MSVKLFVGNLPHEMTEQELESLFADPVAARVTEGQSYSPANRSIAFAPTPNGCSERTD